MDVKIDEASLKKIAEMTDGKYFRATDNDKLKGVYREINKLEKSRINVTEYRKKHEEFLPYAIAAACLLFLEFVLSRTLFKSVV